MVALDWTDFDADGHATIMLSLITPHGRALPLVWRSVPKARLKGHRNQYEDEVLLRLYEVLPAGVRVTCLPTAASAISSCTRCCATLASTSSCASAGM